MLMPHISLLMPIRATPVTDVFTLRHCFRLILFLMSPLLPFRADFLRRHYAAILMPPHALCHAARLMMLPATLRCFRRYAFLLSRRFFLCFRLFTPLCLRCHAAFIVFQPRRVDMPPLDCFAAAA